MTTKPSAPVVATDVARLAGVSQKTVSRVVRGDASVSETTRKLVQAAITELGYRPNRAARSLVSGRTGAIGMLAVGTTHYGPATLMVAAEQAVRTSGYTLTMANSRSEHPDDVARDIQHLVDQGIDGLIVIEGVGHFSSDLSLGSLPVASLGAGHGISSCELVFTMDEAGGTRAATEHLLTLGHRTVHHVAGPEGWRSSTRRREGWQTALLEAGATPPATPPAALTAPWTSQGGYAVGKVLAEDPSVTAVLAANDLQALGLIRAFHEAGKQVGRDVSVIGFDDIPEAAYLTTALTTVRQDLAAMATRAVTMLVGALTDPEPSSHHELLPTELIIRETTSSPTTSRRQS